MSKKNIRLGDEVQDVTSKTSGIAIGKIQWLNGRRDWIVQPFTTDDNERLQDITVSDAYLLKIGDGVYPQPERHIGFHARKVGLDGD